MKLLVLGQVEALIVGMVSWVPTALGMVLRSVVYRLMGMKQGGVSWIQQGVVLVDLRKISIGRNFGCNSGSYINGVGTITIGNDVLIGTNVTISSGKHEIDGRECSVYSRPSKPVPITIGDDVWIGAGAVIMPGVKLASGTVVGANAVVVRDTEEYSVVVGVPARHIHFR